MKVSKKFPDNRENLNRGFADNDVAHTWEEEDSLANGRSYRLYYNYTYGKIPIGAVVEIKGKFKPMMWMYNDFKVNFGYIRSSKGEVFDLDFNSLEVAKKFVEKCLISKEF